MQLSLPWRYGQNKPWTSIPRLNRDHPLAFGLNSFICPDTWGAPEVVSGNSRFVTKWSNGNIVSTAKGNGLRVPSGTGASFPFALTKTSTPSTGTGDYTIAALVIFNTIVGRNFLGQLSATSNAGLFENDNASQFLIMYSSSVETTTTISAVAGKLFALVGTRTGTTLTLYINGVPTSNQINGPSSNSVYTAAGGNSYYLGGFNGGSDTSDTTFLAFGGWNRALSQAEALAWSFDPYCFLNYPEDDMFSSLVGVTAAATLAAQPTNIFAECEW